MQETNTPVQLLKLDSIQISKTNPRRTFNEEKLKELADSIRRKGLISPVVVRPANGTLNGDGAYELIVGERRYRASLLAELSTIPAIVRQMTDQEVLETQILENLQRDDLLPHEEAQGYKALVDKFGYTIDDLAQKLSKSKSYVYGTLKLCDLPEAAMKAISEGVLAKSTAQLIARIPNAELRKKAAEEILNRRYGSEPLSFRQAKDQIESQFMIELKGAPFPQGDKELVPGAGSCDICPKKCGNNRDLYPDARADVCSDPACYQAKVEAFKKRTSAKAEADGMKVLSMKEAGQIYPQWSGGNMNYAVESKYVDIKKTCEADKEKRTFKQLLGEAAKEKTVLAFDHQGRAHYLMEINGARAIIKEKHNLDITSRGRTFDSPEATEEQRKLRRRLKRARKIYAAATQALVQAVEMTPVKLDKETEACLRWLTDKTTDWYRIRETAERRGWTDSNKVDQSVGKMTIPELLGLINELRLKETYQEYGDNPGFSKEGKALLTAYSVDLQDIGRKIDSDTEAKKSEKELTEKKGKRRSN